jgi:hypothetical protein
MIGAERKSSSSAHHLALHLKDTGSCGLWENTGNNFEQISYHGEAPRLISRVELTRGQCNELTDVCSATARDLMMEHNYQGVCLAGIKRIRLHEANLQSGQTKLWSIAPGNAAS